MSIIDEACLPREEEQGAILQSDPMTMFASYIKDNLKENYYDYINNICIME